MPNKRLKTIAIIFLLLFYVYLHVCLCTVCVPDASGGQERVDDRYTPQTNGG